MRIRIVIGTAAVSLAAIVAVTAEQATPAAQDVPTFTRDVAPVLYRNCTGCHRPGEIGPFSLLTYEDARPYAAAIRDEVADGTMPPWHADPKHGRFANDRSLTAAEKDTILRWARGGAPRGAPEDMPPAPTYTEGWELGEPDAVLAMPVEYKVPADGFIEYEYFEVPTNFDEDKWVRAVEVRPGNRAVVHHVIVSSRPPQPERRPGGFRGAPGMAIPPGQTGGGPEKGDVKRPRGQSLFPAPPRGGGVMIGGFAPGTTSMSFDEGSALLIRAGSTLILQMHYTSNGTPQTDRTKVGLTFAKTPPAVEMRMGTLVNGSLRIPPGASDYSIAAEMTAVADIRLRQLLPHTHLRGRKWEYTVTYPDGRSEIILSVPNYDFNWQTDYVFAEPLKLPAGTKIRAVAWYDNSAANVHNPDPTAEVRWGDQTWEEMMFTSFVYSIDGVAPGATLPPPTGGR